MLELWLVRHGETTWNRERRWQGHSDAPLSELGRRQAAALAPRFAGDAFDLVFSSDLSRARDTARLALPARTALLEEPRLREMDFGAWEGLRFDQLGAEDQARLAGWGQDPDNFGAPGGETWRDLVRRVGAWATELPDRGRVAVFVHGGTIRAYLHEVARIAADPDRPFVVANGSLSRVARRDSAIEVLQINDVSHLADLASEAGF